MRDVDNNEFLNNKEIIRLFEEYYEKIRRRKIINGEWREEESRDRIQSLIEEEEGKSMGPDAWSRFKREYRHIMNEMALADNPN